MLQFKVGFLFALNAKAVLDKDRYYSKASAHCSLFRHAQKCCFYDLMFKLQQAPEIPSCHESSAFHYEKSEKHMNQSFEG